MEIVVSLIYLFRLSILTLNREKNRFYNFYFRTVQPDVYHLILFFTKCITSHSSTVLLKTF